MAEIAPIPRSRSLADRTYRHIKDLVLSNRLLPGQTITETWLAEALAVSRTPIRHAISRLSGEGLVVVSRGRIQIRQILADEARQLAEFRIAVEGHVARTLADDGLPEGGFAKLEELSQALSALVTERGECHKFGEFMDINRSLHLEMARQAGNPMIIDAVSRAHDLLTITKQTLDGIPGRPGAILREHAAILAAIRDRDVAAADAAVAHHILAPLGAKIEEVTEPATFGK